MALQPKKMEDQASIVDVIDRVLDKGLVINADIQVSLAGVELLGIKLRAALASFETAAKYGMELPAGTNMKTQAWEEAKIAKENCPQCHKRIALEMLITEECPWCEWKSEKAEHLKTIFQKPKKS